MPANRIYQMSNWWRIWRALQLTFSVVISLVLVYLLFDFNYNLAVWSSWIFVLFILLSLAMTVYYARYLLDITTGRLTITPDFLEYKSLVRQSKLFFTEIRGYQAAYPATLKDFNGKMIIAIVPMQDIKKRKIKVSPFVQNHEDLMEWLKANFKQLIGRKHVDD